MPLAKLDCVHLAYGHIPLLDGVNFQVDPGERVGLIGRNGTGKSSLLAVLAGERDADDGLCWQQPGVALTYVRQEPLLDHELTVFACVVAGLGDVSAQLARYHDIAKQLEDCDAAQSEMLLAQLVEVQHELESQGAWTLESQVEQVISRFSLQPDAVVGTLSGGQKKRLALACALVKQPDLLLLDEPTNHLDIAAIEWMEEYLLQLPVAIVFITHDRRFLDRLATRIVELDCGVLQSYPGSFSQYQRRKDEQLNAKALSQAREDKLLKAEEIWIRKGVEARRTRAVFRVQRLDALRLARQQRRESLGQVQMRLERGQESGQLVVEMKDVVKRFGAQPVVDGLSCRIQRGDKVGLIGPNGAGKTTLLRLMLGELQADSGMVKQGTRLQIAYFDQFRSQLDPESTLIDILSPGAEMIEMGGVRKHVISYLEDFLFDPQRARSPVKSLSGGERNRLLLARLFARPANVLVLDEPTNDLDMDTLELLEQLLHEYQGCVFLVSHDRVFLDQVVTQSIVSLGRGKWLEFAGGYADWQSWRSSASGIEQLAALRADPRPVAKPVKAPPTSSASVASAKRVKLSYKEQRELQELPDLISQLEAEQQSIEQQLQEPSLYQDVQRAQQLSRRLGEIEAQLDHNLQRWEALEAR